jgi:UPF0755 protein
MPRGNRKGLLFLLCALCFVVLICVIACSPRGSDNTVRNIVVKRGTKITTVAHNLESEGLVRSKYLFILCSSLLYRGKIVAGEYELSRQLSIIQMARKMAKGERKIYTLKIVEGYNIYTMGDVIQKSGIMDRSAFLQLANNNEFLNKLGINGISIEGYLFPDTYFFSKETDVDEFLARIIQRTIKLFEKDDIQQQMVRLRMTMPDVLCLASIIEKEAKLENEKKLISTVFHNRLRLGMTLDADPTVIYGQGSFDRGITKSDLAAANPYNTYRHKGLPKGPICNPSKGSIIAALNPEQKDILYFVSKNDGSHVFSRTIEEHNHYVTLYQRHKNKTRGSEETMKRKRGENDFAPSLRARVIASS